MQADSLYLERNNPMSEWMMEMMDAFGMVDKVGDYNGSPYSAFSPYSALSGFPGGVPSSITDFSPSALMNNPLALKHWQQTQTLGNLGANAPWMQPLIPPPHESAAKANLGKYEAVPGFFATEKDDHALVEAEIYAQKHGTGEAISGAVNTSLLDGIWRSRTNEVLVIANGRFMWRDVHKRQLAGYLQVVGTLMLATIPGQDKPIEFFYAISGNYLNVYDASSGRVFNFFRSRQ